MRHSERSVAATLELRQTMKKYSSILLIFVIYFYCCKSDPTGTDLNDDALNDTTITRISININNESQVIEGFGGYNTIQNEGSNWDASLAEKYDILAL